MTKEYSWNREDEICEHGNKVCAICLNKFYEEKKKSQKKKITLWRPILKQKYNPNGLKGYQYCIYGNWYDNKKWFGLDRIVGWESKEVEVEE